MTETIRISGPDSLVGSIPALLGFTPQDSLVLIALKDGKLVVTARLDLADAAGPERTLEETCVAIFRANVDKLIAVVWVDDVDGTDLPHKQLATDIELAVEPLVGIKLSDVLITDGSRLWSYLCGNKTCCGPDGRPVSNLALTGFVVAGQGPLAQTRDELASRLSPAQDEHRVSIDKQREMIHSLQGDPEDWIGDFLEAMRADSTDWLPHDVAAQYGLMLNVVEMRDQVWVAVDSDRDLPGHLLLTIARQLEGRLAAVPYALYGWWSWRDGNGATAQIASSRALQAYQSLSMAELLEELLAQATNPLTTPTMPAPGIDYSEAELITTPGAAR